jgi:hypothetical protein
MPADGRREYVPESCAVSVAAMHRKIAIYTASSVGAHDTSGRDDCLSQQTTSLRLSSELASPTHSLRSLSHPHALASMRHHRRSFSIATEEDSVHTWVDVHRRALAVIHRRNAIIYTDSSIRR